MTPGNGPAAKERGYKYIAITDHSQSLTVTNGLTIERLHQQRKEIEEAQKEIGDGFRILHGTEVEIKLDGTLDFPDEVLAWLDIVVASIHSGLRGPPKQVTQRALAAARNPNVDIIGPPDGPPYQPARAIRARRGRAHNVRPLKQEWSWKSMPHPTASTSMTSM